MWWHCVEYDNVHVCPFYIRKKGKSYNNPPLFSPQSTYYVEAGIDAVPTVDKSFSSNFEIMNA